MKTRLPEGWPGGVGIAVLIGGMLLVHAPPRTTTLGGMAAPAAGYLDEFLYASLDGPQVPLNLAAAPEAYRQADAAVTALGESGYVDRHRSVIAVFDTAAAADEALRGLALGDEETAFALDRMLMVVGLPTGVGDEPTPLAEDLAGSADVLVEGDRYGEGSIVLDLSCTAPDAATAAAISTALGDYGAMPYYAYLRPPWRGEPLTSNEALARSTYRRWATSYRAAFQSDPWISAWSSRYVAATTDDERRALMREMTDHVGAVQPDVEGEAHPGVMALLDQGAEGADADAYYDWGHALGTLAGMLPTEAPDGRPTWFEQRYGAQVGAVRASGERVDIGWVSSNTFAVAATGLLSYLDAQGCANARIALSDFDDVRGD